MEMNKGVGKRESKKPKKPQQLELRDTPRKGQSRVLCPFHGLTAKMNQQLKDKKVQQIY